MREILVAVLVIGLGVVSAQAREVPIDPAEADGGSAVPAAAASSSEAHSSTSTDASLDSATASATGTTSVDPVVNLVAAPAAAAAQVTGQPRQRKSMVATILLWLVVPGGGNFYNGAIGKGLIELGGTVGGVALAATSWREKCEVVFRTQICFDEISAGQVWAGVGTIAAFRIWGLITAINRTDGINNGTISPFERIHISIPTKKNPFKVAYTQNF